jgi:hypothetical protein
MEMMEFLQLSQYPTQQTVMEDGSGIDGGSLFWSEDSSPFFYEWSLTMTFSMSLPAWLPWDGSAIH